jgi:hypothetical protein
MQSYGDAFPPDFAKARFAAKSGDSHAALDLGPMDE